MPGKAVLWLGAGRLRGPAERRFPWRLVADLKGCGGGSVLNPTPPLRLYWPQLRSSTETQFRHAIFSINSAL